MPVTTRGDEVDGPTLEDNEAKSPAMPTQSDSVDDARDETPAHMAAKHAQAKAAGRQELESDEEPSQAQRVLIARAREAAAAIEAGGGKRMRKRKSPDSMEVLAQAATPRALAKKLKPAAKSTVVAKPRPPATSAPQRKRAKKSEKRAKEPVAQCNTAERTGTGT